MYSTEQTDSMMETRVQLIPPRLGTKPQAEEGIEPMEASRHEAGRSMKPACLLLGQEGDKDSSSCEDSACAMMPPTPATCAPEGSSGDGRDVADQYSDEDEERAQVPSLGSKLHGSGDCRPCAWFWKPQGCLNGKNCLRCHLCPSGEIKRRKKAQLKLALVQGEDSSVGEDDIATSVPSSAVVTPSYQSSPEKVCMMLPPPPPAFVPQVQSSDVMPPPPAWDPDHLPSVGSREHGTGQCRPCAWYWKSQGCANGFECGHCHLCPKGEAKARKQAKLAALRKDTASLTAQEAEDSEENLWRPPPGLGWGQTTAGQVQTSVLPLTVAPVAQAMAEPPPPPMMPPPPVLPPSLPSYGSARHDSGDCIPCPAFLSDQGCWEAQCPNCHICSAELRPLQKAKLAGIPLVSFSPMPRLTSGCDTCGSELFCTCRSCDVGVQISAAPEQDAQKVQLQEPQMKPSNLPSAGSALHSSGACIPCAWFWKPQGCQNGSSCGRCHLCPPGEVKARKKAKLAAMTSKSGSPAVLAPRNSETASSFIAPCGALILD
eukprot:TRINITY_DN3242_c0_g1_i1.p1 TRINITY_DN3242_c0_g1~~TRINITY_DN3242_c0_g1_i1.p1  ORF type:complete len:578 (+),score=105.34 TRINITY_DN3242_c0_g1_i1:106-1734(+)